jgi:hypothetical protein
MTKTLAFEPIKNPHDLNRITGKLDHKTSAQISDLLSAIAELTHHLLGFAASGRGG